MSIFKNKPSPVAKRAGSHFALAVALATGAAVMSGVIAEPAHAAKKKKQKDGADYSEGFVAVFAPLQEAFNAEGADRAALASQIPAVVAAVQTPSDRFAAGQMVYNIGLETKNTAMQLQGAEMMLESGKVPAEATGQYNFLAAQLAYNSEIWPKARKYGTAALAAGYTQNNPQLVIAESYFGEGMYEDGLNFLRQAIKAKTDAGEKVPGDWIKRGLSQAYNNDLNAQAVDFSMLYVTNYPDQNSWGDAIAIQRNLNRYEEPELLDLLRLSRRVNGLRTVQDYEDYVQAADARRLPGEVESLIAEGQSKGLITGGNMFIAEADETAKSRIRSDRAELPTLERDAKKSDATTRTVVAAGDAFMSYGEYAKAEGFYDRALQLPGADTQLVLNRLGITQTEQGKYDQARMTFAKVDGTRKPIARLWTIYVDQREKPAMPVAAPEAPANDGGM